MRWDIRRDGRSWTAEEFDIRVELRPEKLEIYQGKLLWNESDRINLLGMLAENVGADSIVRLGDPDVWRKAIDELTVPDRQFRRWMTILTFLNGITVPVILLIFSNRFSVERLSLILVIGACATALARLVVWFLERGN